MALICADGRENARGGPRDCRPAEQIQLAGLKGTEQSPGGARAGHASLMRPNRPLPTLPFAKFAATPRPEQCRGGHGGLGNPGASRLPFGLIARITRTSTSDPAHTKSYDHGRRCQWAVGRNRSHRVSFVSRSSTVSSSTGFTRATRQRPHSPHAPLRSSWVAIRSHTRWGKSPSVAP